jgi:hypothetical protein
MAWPRGALRWTPPLSKESVVGGLAVTLPLAVDTRVDRGRVRRAGSAGARPAVRRGALGGALTLPRAVDARVDQSRVRRAGSAGAWPAVRRGLFRGAKALPLTIDAAIDWRRVRWAGSAGVRSAFGAGRVDSPFDGRALALPVPVLAAIGRDGPVRTGSASARPARRAVVLAGSRREHEGQSEQRGQGKERGTGHTIDTARPVPPVTVCNYICARVSVCADRLVAAAGSSWVHSCGCVKAPRRG